MFLNRRDVTVDCGDALRRWCDVTPTSSTPADPEVRKRSNPNYRIILSSNIQCGYPTSTFLDRIDCWHVSGSYDCRFLTIIIHEPSVRVKLTSGERRHCQVGTITWLWVQKIKRLQVEFNLKIEIINWNQFASKKVFLGHNLVLLFFQQISRTWRGQN